MAALEVRVDPASFELEEIAVRARKSDIEVEALSLAWMPWALGDAGDAVPLAE